MRSIVALSVAFALAGVPAMAQTAAEPPQPTGAYGMPIQNWQGLGCLWGSVAGGAGVFYYSDVLAVAATGATNPLLLVPLIATGILGGCSVGYNSAPGVIWLYRAM